MIALKRARVWVIRAMPELKSVFCFDVFPESNSCACLAALFGRDRDWSRAIAVEPGPKLGPSSDQEEEQRSQFEEEESTSRKDLRLRVILVRLP